MSNKSGSRGGRGKSSLISILKEKNAKCERYPAWVWIFSLVITLLVMVLCVSIGSVSVRVPQQYLPQEQRVFLAQLFAQNPKILVLDEPTNHLDLIFRQQVFNPLFAPFRV